MAAKKLSIAYGNRLTRTVLVRMDQPLYNAVIELANEKERSVSDMVRVLLRRGVRRQVKP